MNGKIDKDGFLHIERAGVIKKQRCINNPDMFCGDWCHSFGDIIRSLSTSESCNYVDKFGNCGWKMRPHLKLCTGEQIFDNLTDER